jgi:signal transduction histidine kinase
MTEEEKDCLHDMNNKLSIILGTVALIKRTQCPDCKVMALLDSIHTASLEISGMLMSHRKKLRQENLTRMSLDELFQVGNAAHNEILRLGKEMSLNIEIRNQMSMGCSILASSTILESAKQFINNVFFNAKKAGASHINIIAVEHADYIAIHIADNGNGMSSETLSCLGLSIASKTSTGEGTRIAKKLAIKEGAVVEWSSPGIGAGSCVTIRMTKYKEVI